MKIASPNSLTQEGSMSQLDATMSAFNEYLQTGTEPLSRSSATHYTSIIKQVLVTADIEDLSNPQMIHYMRTGLSESYRANFPSAWRAFQKFCRMDDVELPDLPELRRVRFVHPIGPDVFRLLSKFYNGIPADLTWEKFLVTEQDDALKFSALRAYEFFTGVGQVLGNQPLVARSAESLNPVPSWVLESIAASKSKRTSGLIERVHADLNVQISDAKMPVGVSRTVYQMFVAGYPNTRRREQASVEEAFVLWENLIRSRDAHGLIASVRSYCRLPKDTDLDQIIFQ